MYVWIGPSYLISKLQRTVIPTTFLCKIKLIFLVDTVTMSIYRKRAFERHTFNEAKRATIYASNGKEGQRHINFALRHVGRRKIHTKQTKGGIRMILCFVFQTRHWKNGAFYAYFERNLKSYWLICILEQGKRACMRLSLAFTWVSFSGIFRFLFVFFEI